MYTLQNIHRKTSRLAIASAAIGLTFSGYACAEKSTENTAVAETSAAPALWKLSDDDSTLYLFGTFHILPPEIEWETPAYKAAMIDAETTITEADTDSPESQAAIQAAIPRLAFNPPGTTLSSILGEERAAALSKVAEKYGVPYANLEPLRPWFATLTLSLVAFQGEGFDPNSGVEKILVAQAKEEGDKISHLETALQQLEILASLDEEETLANFDATIMQLTDFKEVIGQMLDAWKTGDTNALETLFTEQLRKQSPDAFEKLLVARNRNWVNQIKDIIAGKGDYFIAVGAGHLVGEDSVVDLLEDEGFTVERIQ